MRSNFGSVNELVPAGVFGVHIGDVLVFGVTANTAFAHAVIHVAELVFELLDDEALAEVDGVDDVGRHRSRLKFLLPA